MSSGKDCPLKVCQPLILDGRKRRIGREKYSANVLRTMVCELTVEQSDARQRGQSTYLEAVLANAALNPAVRAS